MYSASGTGDAMGSYKLLPIPYTWYCALKLEMMLHLARRVLRSTGLSPAPSGCDLDDDFASFEWGAGGITHLHIVVLWLELLGLLLLHRAALGHGSDCFQEEIINMSPPIANPTHLAQT